MSFYVCVFVCLCGCVCVGSLTNVLMVEGEK